MKLSTVSKLASGAMWLVLSLFSLSAIVLINQFSPYVPDYDGLTYFDQAKTINSWLFSPTDFTIKTDLFLEQLSVKFYPITNAVSVFIAALLLHVVDNNLLPTLINSLYLFLFAVCVAKIRSNTYAYVAILLLCSNTLFYRLFTTLTSEFSVGLWLFAFLLILTSGYARREVYLAALTIIGILLRTVDVVFIAMAVSAYVLTQYALWNNKQQALATLRNIGLCLLVTLPLFLQHYKVAFDYVYQASFGPTSVVWKAMGGVSGRSDVLLQYINYLNVYNVLIMPLASIVVVFGLYVSDHSRRFTAQIIGVVLAVCAPLMLASTLNIQVVFWIYAVLVFAICELGRSILTSSNLGRAAIFVQHREKIKALVAVALLLNCMWLLAGAWSSEVSYLRNQRDVSKISFDISDVLHSEQAGSTFAANFIGVGALDLLGLSWGRSETMLYGGVNDFYSKGNDPSYYLNLKETTNFYVTAHENYFFPLFFGINEHIKATHLLFGERGSELGFKKIQEISREGKNFDIWFRPSVRAHLQFAGFGDNWIGSILPLNIGSQKLCAGDRVSGSLKLRIDIPNPGRPDYLPPFTLFVRSKGSSEILSSAVVSKYGEETVILALNHVSCGAYELYFDKTFSTKADPRALSAKFVGLVGVLKFDAHAPKIDIDPRL